MSRCFPFPPPGYERKAGADNVDLLKQDKQREKKHKKEKRDKEKREKEKREGKEKKEKDRGDEKHRDKKEKKDKHRDKKDKEKDKDKERERDRSSTSNEKNQPVQLLEHKGAPASQAGEKSSKKEKDKTRNSIADSKRPSSGGQNGERVVSANHVASRVSDVKCIQELAKRLKNDQCSGTEQASTIPDQRKNDVKGQRLGKAAGTGLEGKERTKDRRHNNNNEKKMDERVIKEQTGLNGTVKVQSFGEAPGRTKLQEIANPSEVNPKEMEWREIMTGREGDDKRVLKDQYIDTIKGKVKESRKKEEKSEQKHSDQEKLKASNKNGLPGSPHFNSLQPMKEPDKNVDAEGNLKKRKAETNGFLLGDEVRANKLQRQAQDFQSPVKNGMETHKMTTKKTSSRPEAVSNVKVNKEEKKINGVKGGAHASPISPLHHPPSSSAAAQEAELVLLAAAEATVKAPHPDSKFLGEILKVPKLDELPDLDDDQGWLFSSSSKEVLKKKSNVLERSPEEVWGESIHIESADICALPYVFPY